MWRHITETIETWNQDVALFLQRKKDNDDLQQDKHHLSADISRFERRYKRFNKISAAKNQKAHSKRISRSGGTKSGHLSVIFPDCSDKGYDYPVALSFSRISVSITFSFFNSSRSSFRIPEPIWHRSSGRIMTSSWEMRSSLSV